MAIILESDTVDIAGLSDTHAHYLYNGLDCCMTNELLSVIEPQLDDNTRKIYEFEKALQAPVMEMMCRGILIDRYMRKVILDEQFKLKERLEAILDRYAKIWWGKGLNPGSPKQLNDFFYGACQVPEIKTIVQGKWKVSTNREALEKMEAYLHVRPIVKTILALRDVQKKISVLTTEFDDDGRFHPSFNIAGTECISADSIIWTKQGLKTAKDQFRASSLPVLFNGIEYYKATRKVMYPCREGFEIKLEHGYQIKCSDNHPLMTQRGWVPSKALKVGDSVRVQVGFPGNWGDLYISRDGNWRPADLLSEELCEFIGMWLADGSLQADSEHYRVRLSNRNPCVRARYVSLVKKLFGVTPGEYEGEICFSSKNVALWMKSLDLPCSEGLGSATIKTIPAQFLKGTPNLLRALLRGLTLDSHLTDNGLIYGTQSPKMQDQIQQLLLALGIISSKLECGNSIKLKMARNACGRFLNIIGFVEEDKATKLASWLNQRIQWHEPPAFGSFVYLPVKEILSWTGDVFDFSMPEESPPQYVAQGMLIHNTGRFSSSSNAFGRGTNAQNITAELRQIFVADPGKKIAYIDLEQAESRGVGLLAWLLTGKDNYLNACYAGDLHTIVCRMVWSSLTAATDITDDNGKLLCPKGTTWGDDAKVNKAIAEQLFYRTYSYRDLAKRGGHGSNYYAQPATVSRHLKIDIDIANVFQAAYFRAFPEIREWHNGVRQELMSTGILTTPFGRKRTFWSRLSEDSTLRAAIAFVPQSFIADTMNLGLYRVWKNVPQAELMLQIHDAIVVQYPEEMEDEILPKIIENLVVTYNFNGRDFSIPCEPKVGWNWGNFSDGEDVKAGRAPRVNLDGLKKYKGTDTRKRQVHPGGNLLSRIVG